MGIPIIKGKIKLFETAEKEKEKWNEKTMRYEMKISSIDFSAILVIKKDRALFLLFFCFSILTFLNNYGNTIWRWPLIIDDQNQMNNNRMLPKWNICRLVAYYEYRIQE